MKLLREERGLCRHQLRNVLALQLFPQVLFWLASLTLRLEQEIGRRHLHLKSQLLLPLSDDVDLSLLSWLAEQRGRDRISEPKRRVEHL